MIIRLANIDDEEKISELITQFRVELKQLGGTTVFNWVHPNNDKIIKFLSKLGYNVLNLIEIRKPWENEKLNQKIRVGNHEYNY